MSNEFNSLNAITDGSSYKPAEHNPLSAGIYDVSTDQQSWQRTLSSFKDNNIDMKTLGFPDSFGFETPQQARDVYAPHNGMYTPVQPFGFEGHKGETWKAPRAGDHESVPWREYLEKPVINADGSTLYTYLGGINDAHQNNSFIGSERHDPDGRLVVRKASYRHGVPMKFEMEGGKALDVNVKFVESCLDKSTGNFRTLVYPFDPSQPRGESKTPLRIITAPNGKSRFATPEE